jgi:helix-turn-helix protein
VTAADPAAETLALVVNDWLRRRTVDGDLPPTPLQRAALARAAFGAPRLAACLPALMRAVGPSVAYRVKVQATALAVSEEAQAAAGQAGWLTTAQAASLLGISAHGVRDLLRRGRLDGRRNESRGGAGWQVDAAGLALYVSRRRYGTTAA